MEHEVDDRDLDRLYSEISDLQAKLAETDRQLTAVEHINAREKQELRAALRDLYEPARTTMPDDHPFLVRARQLLNLEQDGTPS